jgi:hypothetical protein
MMRETRAMDRAPSQRLSLHQLPPRIASLLTSDVRRTLDQSSPRMDAGRRGSSRKR